MGFNSVVMILNDPLHELERNPNLGEHIGYAIQEYPKECNGNQFRVLGSNHADQMHLYAVGGNTGRDLGFVGGYRSNDVEILKALAEKMGFRVVKKRKIAT